MKIRRTSSLSFASEDVDLGTSPAKLELDEINDHRPAPVFPKNSRADWSSPEKLGLETEFGLPPSNMKGAFGNEGALRFFAPHPFQREPLATSLCDVRARPRRALGHSGFQPTGLVA
jgi:hypothetical protein